MRILIANDRFQGAGVESYLGSIIPALRARGHEVATLSAVGGDAGDETVGDPHFSLTSATPDRSWQAVRNWHADVGFSHQVRDGAVDQRLLDIAPVVKFVHAYDATCVSGHKMFALPAARACERRFGPACTALYLPRRCGGLSPVTMLRQYREASGRHALLPRYGGIMVASEHMQRECVRNGADARKVQVNPLFPTVGFAGTSAAPSSDFSIVFVGRMTALKGGGLLIRAAAAASRQLGTTLRLTMVGDGPERAECERLAKRLGVPCTFTGWQRGDDRWRWFQQASVLALPGPWPEPFGLVGLEAAALGIPAIAFDTGGIREWLTHGENGYLVTADSPTASAFADGLVDVFRQPERLRAMRQKACAAARHLSLERHLDRLEHTLLATTHA